MSDEKRQNRPHVQSHRRETEDQSEAAQSDEAFAQVSAAVGVQGDECERQDDPGDDSAHLRASRGP